MISTYAQLIPTTVNNLKSAARFRPADMVNWAHLVKPLRQTREAGDPTFDLYALAFHMFTRLPFEYTPARERSAAKPMPWQPTPIASPSVGLFADAPEHLSGVATTLRHWNDTAQHRGHAFRIHSAGDQPVIPGAECFSRTGSFQLSAYAGLTLHMPAVKDILDYVKASRFDVMHLSTPGPVGLIGLLAAKMYSIPVVSTFHTHFPSYVARLTGDPTLEDVAWCFMKWFYNQMDLVAAPTQSVKDELAQRGCRADRIRVVGRGVDRDRFSPRQRDESLRLDWGPRQRIQIIYVGRLSREKNLECLADAYLALSEKHPDIGLVFVGDGPYRDELELKLRGTPAVFAGIQKGDDLARHYASADLFVFPSETDTLGNVVLEAQASGLPVIVSSHGGPKDCVQDGVTGWILPEMSATTLAQAIATIAPSAGDRARMGAAARHHSARFTHDRAFDDFWALHPEAMALRAQA